MRWNICKIGAIHSGLLLDINWRSYWRKFYHGSKMNQFMSIDQMMIFEPPYRGNVENRYLCLKDKNFDPDYNKSYNVSCSLLIFFFLLRNGIWRMELILEQAFVLQTSSRFESSDKKTTNLSLWSIELLPLSLNGTVFNNNRPVVTWLFVLISHVLTHHQL